MMTRAWVECASAAYAGRWGGIMGCARRRRSRGGERRAIVVIEAAARVGVVVVVVAAVVAVVAGAAVAGPKRWIKCSPALSKGEGGLGLARA